MSTVLPRRGSVLSLAVAATAVVVVGLVAVTSLSRSASKLSPSATSSPRPALFVPATNAELAVVLHTLGLDPATLAAAGVTPGETTTLVGNMRSHLSTHMDGFRSADNDCGAARNEYDRLLRLVQAGLAGQEDRTAWATAPGTLSTAIAARQSLRDAAFTAAADGLSGAKVSAITTARANHASWDLLLPHMFTNREQVDWVTLRDALSNQRIAAKHGDSTDPAAQGIIMAADAQPATALARANLEANLATVTAAWNQAVNQ